MRFCRYCGAVLEPSGKCSLCFRDNLLDLAPETAPPDAPSADSLPESAPEETIKETVKAESTQKTPTMIPLFYFIGVVFGVIGFYKLWFYDYGINEYVGGDAFNLIINAGQATAYFVLAIGLILIGAVFSIRNDIRNQCNYKTSEENIK